jgi:hypothetical protein
MANEVGLDLGTAIITEIYKKTIIGSTTAAFVEGGWSIFPNTDPNKWMCFAGIRPVYVEECLCEGELPEQYTGETEEEFLKRKAKSKFPIKRVGPESDERYFKRLERETFESHWTTCLQPVGFYDEDIELALEVLTHLKPTAFSLHNIDGEWIAELYDASKVFRGKADGPIDKIDTAATAICRAALDFVRAPAKVPK